MKRIITENPFTKNSDSSLCTGDKMVKHLMVRKVILGHHFWRLQLPLLRDGGESISLYHRPTVRVDIFEAYLSASGHFVLIIRFST